MRWMAVIFFAIVFLISPIAHAHAHDWYSNTIDPVLNNKCCGGKDCAPVNPEWVSETKTGYRLKMTVDQARTINPLASLPIDAVIPWSRVQAPPKADHLFYACIWEKNREHKDGDGVICFFATPVM